VNDRTGQRIIGIETEFGTMVSDPELGSPEEAVEAIKDCIFYDLRMGAIDLHARDDVFEPARSGGFLLNGGRMYVDAVGSHLEYATAETVTLKDLIANDRAGQRMIVQAIKHLGFEGQIQVFNNSVDHFGGHTFGCHENYLVKMEDDFYTGRVQLLVPFLVTRQIYAGVGRVGGHRLGSFGSIPRYEDVAQNPVDYIWVSNMYSVAPDLSVPFQLSQRADHILKVLAGRVRFNRALINPKWEQYYAHDEMQRLHVLFGESNQNEFAYALKVGATHLALRLLEDGLIDETHLLADPLGALREISRDQSYQWKVQLLDGSASSAVEVQQRVLDLAQRYRGSNADTDWTLDAWQSTLDQLVKDPMALADKLDWVKKRQIVESYMAEEDIGWEDDALHSVDLMYHNINPDESLFYAVQDMGETTRVATELDVVEAMTDPPSQTRAKGRSELIRRIMAGGKDARIYGVDWSAVLIGRHEVHEFPDPYETYSETQHST